MFVGRSLEHSQVVAELPESAIPPFYGNLAPKLLTQTTNRPSYSKQRSHEASNGLILSNMECRFEYWHYFYISPFGFRVTGTRSFNQKRIGSRRTCAPSGLPKSGLQRADPLFQDRPLILVSRPMSISRDRLNFTDFLPLSTFLVPNDT